MHKSTWNEITTRTAIQSLELVSDTVGELNNKAKGRVCPFNMQEQHKQNFLCGLNRDLTPQTGSRQLGLSKCWQMGEWDELCTINFKGCKYYVDVMCTTVEWMKRQISAYFKRRLSSVSFTEPVSKPYLYIITVLPVTGSYLPEKQ